MSNEQNEKAQHLKALRHTTEHILTQAMLKLCPGIKMAMGPATDDGFYFDFDYTEKITEENFPAIEAEMQIIIAADLPISRKEISIDEAKILFEGNPYKQEWLSEIEKRNEPATVYWTGDQFVDLCAGPHIESTGNVHPDAFKLLSVAGAYWHGDEKNKMLTRIYGTAFDMKEELEAYLTQQEEAKKHDHRKLGVELDLFVFSELVGKGLPMLTPKGATIRRELERFTIDEELRRGYQHVLTPALAKTDLFKTSGHYPYYKDTMYPVMKVDDDELILRPMTCPHHFMLYKSRPRSYRELPLRIAECADLFRYEKSGELTGLMRARMFCLADAHIFVTNEQAKDEIKRVLDLIDYMNEILGLKKGEDYRYRLSLGDRSDDKKYYKDDAAWDNAEQVLREVVIETNAPYYEAAGEAAFYGPKIDVQMKKINGVEETAFTVQYDFVMPKRFTLTYIDKDGSENEPVVIHRSSIGAFERIMAFLIEKYGGAFPVWLAPIQAMIIPIADRHHDYAKKIQAEAQSYGIRIEIDSRDEKMQSKIRDAQMQKIPYMLVVGDREETENSLAVRFRDQRNETMPIDSFLTHCKEIIEKKALNL